MPVCIRATVFRLRNGIPGTARLIRTTPQRVHDASFVFRIGRLSRNSHNNVARNSGSVTQTGSERVEAQSNVRS